MGIALGVRCWKDRVAVVALRSEDSGEPAIILHRRSKVPAGSSEAARVAWIHKAVTEAIEEAEPDVVAVRIADSADADQFRAQHDGVVLLAAAEKGVASKMMRRQSMLKPLGVPNASGAWALFQKTDPFVKSFVGEEQDAAMAAKAALGGTAAS